MKKWKIVKLFWRNFIYISERRIMGKKTMENKKEKWKQVLQLIKTPFTRRWRNVNVGGIKINCWAKVKWCRGCMWGNIIYCNPVVKKMFINYLWKPQSKLPLQILQNRFLNLLIPAPEPRTSISTLRTKTVLPGRININANSFAKFLK